MAGAANRIADAGFRRWYERDGLPTAFLDHVFRTPSKELRFPTRDELAGAHVTTGLAADGTFAVSGFGPRPNLRDTEQQLLALPIYAALQRADPDWPAPMTTWDRMFGNGEAITAFSLELRTHIARNTRRLLPIAPDSTLRQFAAAMLSETEAIQQADPEACWQSLHNGAIERRRYLSPAQVYDELTTSARLLQDATDHPQPRLSTADSKALLARLIVAMRRDGQDRDGALTALRSDAPHAAYCPGFATLVRAAMARPTHDGGSPLQALFSSG